MTKDTPDKRPTEYGYRRNDDGQRPDGTERPLTESERRIGIRKAGMRDEPLPPGVNPGVRVG